MTDREIIYDTRREVSLMLYACCSADERRRNVRAQDWARQLHVGPNGQHAYVRTNSCEIRFVMDGGNDG